MAKVNKTKLLSYLLAIFVISIVPLIDSFKVRALPISGRSIALSTSAGNASGVIYTLTTSALPTATAVKSLEIKFCASLSGACVKPAGFANASSTLNSQPTGLGAASGWTVNTATDGTLRIVNAANATAPSGAVTVVFGGVHNPTATNTAFYGIVTTYQNADWTTPLDSSSIALSTSATIQVALAVYETLTFCTGTSITGQNCGTIAGGIVDLGEGSVSATAKGTSVMAASTNGNTGYSITVDGNTLASGGNQITALAAGAASSVGTKQFGLNLAAANTTPVVGAAKTGAGTGSAAANYNINNTFRFTSGEIVASAAGPTNANTFTVGYIANIDGLTSAGVYSTNLTYTATANF